MIPSASLPQVHALPAVQVGFGAAGFAHKLMSLAHSIRLEHPSAASMALWSSDIIMTMSDQGVERLLPDAAPTPVQHLCPWFDDLSAEEVTELTRGAFIIAGQPVPPHDHDDEALPGSGLGGSR